MNFEHTSVLLEETVAALVTDTAGIYVDCTLGGGGHASAVASRLAPAARLIGLDQDPSAIAAAQARLQNVPCKINVIHSNFNRLPAVLDELGIPLVSGILFDLGVSSHQLDVAERGFSYMQDGPLDMRMNPADALTAYDVVNTYSEQRLAAIIADYGEERWAKRIARLLVEVRAGNPVGSTLQLVDIIKKAIPAPARREGPHPAKRTFQAIRIEVNGELGILRTAIENAVQRLKSGGRICVITFHSLEDRIVKQTLQELAKGCKCPRDFPVCICHNTPTVKILGKPTVASSDELVNNPRARSAKLRVAEKV